MIKPRSSVFVFCCWLISIQVFAAARFVASEPLPATYYAVNGVALCATAKSTLAYLNKGSHYDPLVIHEGKVFKLPLARIKATLAFICQHQQELADPVFVKQHFDFIRWYPDLAASKMFAKNKSLLTHLPRDKILMTKYYVHRAKASNKPTLAHPFALHALPKDEEWLSFEAANAKPELIRFQYGKQAILKGVLATKPVPALAFFNRDDLEAALMQGTVVADFGKHQPLKVFNVHRSNMIPYVKNKHPYQQERYWYFKPVEGIKGYGKDADYKITINSEVTFAADLEQFGLGKLLMVQYPDSARNVITRMGILADTGGAFQDNLYQVDFLAGSYADKKAFYQATRQLPSYVTAYFLVLKESVDNSTHAAFSCHDPQPMYQKPIQFNAERIALTKQYQLSHYGIDSESIEIEPRMIILHWTCIPTLAATFRAFDSPTFPKNSPRTKELPGSLNVSSHFLVDRGGEIYQLMPENWMARHAIGLNHWAIGIENIGGVNGKADLTEEQARANAFLVCYLKKKYPSIKYLIGHREYLKFKNTPLWLEVDPNYQMDKYDPDPAFVERVRRLT